MNVIRCNCKLSTRLHVVIIIFLVAKSVYLVSPSVEIVMKAIVMDDSEHETFERNAFKLFDI